MPEPFCTATAIWHPAFITERQIVSANLLLVGRGAVQLWRKGCKAAWSISCSSLSWRWPSSHWSFEILVCCPPDIAGWDTDLCKGILLLNKPPSRTAYNRNTSWKTYCRRKTLLCRKYFSSERTTAIENTALYLHLACNLARAHVAKFYFW